MKLETTEKLLIESMYLRAVEEGHLKDTFPLVSIERLTGDASARRYYRVQSKRRSYVICLDHPIEETQSSFSKIQDVYKENNVRVPEIYLRRPQKGFYIVEDLGDITLLGRLAKIENHEEEFSTYQKVIDQLLRIHSIPKENYENEEFTSLAFDEEKLFFEIEFTLKYFFIDLAKIKDRDDRLKVLRKHFKRICKILGSQNRVVTHRDFHSRNIMVKDDDYVVIDFQDTRMGPRQYDLSSLLDDSYYKIKGNNVFQLKKYYFENIPFKESFDQFCDTYRLAATQRIFKAIGSFAYIYQTRNDIRYLKYLGFAFEKIKEILLECSDYKDLRKSISEIYYEN